MMRTMMLPKGFRDTWGEEFLSAERIRAIFRKRGHEIGCIDLATSPVSYAETFRQRNNAVDGRVFEFSDKSNRILVLTPDSYYAVMGWYARQGLFLPERIHFTSEVFRYRHQKRRHFTQLGFTLINEQNETEGLALIARAAIKAIKCDMGVDVTIRVTDLGIWENLFRVEGLASEQIKGILKYLRYAEDDATKYKILSAFIKDDPRRLFAQGLLGDEVGSRAEDLPELADSISFAKTVIKGMDCDFTIAPANFHSSEFKNGFSFQLVTMRNEISGEGGIMTLHAQKLNARITSYVSFCSGVEFFIRRGYVDNCLDLDSRVLLVHEPGLEEAATAQADILNGMGLACIVLPDRRDHNRAFKAYMARSGWILRISHGAGDTRWFRLSHAVSGSKLETSSTQDLYALIRKQVGEQERCT
jgi:hypothetical protein